MTVTKSELMDVVMSNVRSNAMPMTKFKNIMDCYHYIDEIQCLEEKKVDLRNAIYNHLLMMRKKIPFEAQIKVASWMYDSVEWQTSRDLM